MPQDSRRTSRPPLTSRERRARRRRTAAVVVALLAALSMVLPTVGSLLPPASGAVPATVVGHPAAPGPRQGEAPVVVVGLAGLDWQDVTPAGTPTLVDLGQRASGANLVVRSVRSSACPLDGWLGLSAGRRTGDVPLEQWGACRQPMLPAPGTPVDGWSEIVEANSDASYGSVPGLLGSSLADAGVSARGIGAGAAVALAGKDGVPVGEVVPLPPTSDQLAGRVRAALAQDPRLLVVDAGTVRDSGRPLSVVPYPDQVDGAGGDPADDSILAELTAPKDSGALGHLDEPSRSSQLLRADARVAAVLREVERSAPDATVLVASLADSGTRAGLRLVAATGPGFTDEGGGLLRSNSTRQSGYVQSYDLTPTLLATLGATPAAGTADLAGSVMTTDPDTASSGADPARPALLADDVLHASAVPGAAPTFTLALILANLLVYATVTVALNRTVLDRVGGLLHRRRRRRDAAPGGRGNRSEGGSHAVTPALDDATTAARAGVGAADLHGTPHVSRRMDRVLAALRAVAVAVAAVPVAATLANLVPWWRADSPGWALTGAVVGWSLLVTLLALVGPWRRWLLGPTSVVAAVTAGVLALDVATGATLQMSNVLGVQPQVGARFYGINNQTFALFATASLLLAAGLAEPLVRRGRRRTAAAVVLAVGVVQVLLNGLPSIGADFGGPPAAVPGFLLLALMAVGLRLTLRRVVGVLAAAGAVVLMFLLADWLRPPEQRTHLGQFFQTVLDGGAWDVVGRKLSANLSLLFGTPLTFLALGGVVVVLVVLSQPLRAEHRAHSTSRTSAGYGWLTGGPSILRLDRAAMMLRPALVAVTVTLTLGFALNDSGILVPALGIALVVPLLIAVLCTWLRRLRGAETSGDAPVVEPRA